MDGTRIFFFELDEDKLAEFISRETGCEVDTQYVDTIATPSKIDEIDAFTLTLKETKDGDVKAFHDPYIYVRAVLGAEMHIPSPKMEAKTALARVREKVRDLHEDDREDWRRLLTDLADKIEAI